MAGKGNVREKSERRDSGLKLPLKYPLLQILYKHRACEHSDSILEGTYIYETSKSQSFLSFIVNQFLR